MNAFNMRRRQTAWLVAALVISCAGAVRCQCADEATPPPAASGEEDSYWNEQVQPFLETYCSDCHTGEDAEAGIDFSVYQSAELLTEQRPRWNQVRGMIEIGAMPPADYDPLPSKEQRERIADWIDHQINSVDCGVVNDPGRVTMRRLNSTEYDNTVRDLLGIEFSPSTRVGFPTDGVGNGFDNQGDVLTLSPIQLEKYLQAARQITNAFIIHDREQLRERSIDGEDLLVTERQQVELEFAEGKYEFNVRMEYGDNDKQTVPVALEIDDKEVVRWDVSGKKFSFREKVEVNAGLHRIVVRFIEDPNTKQRADYERRIEIDRIRVTGPESAPPALPAPHRNLFTSRPDENTSVHEAATEIFTPLLRRAFRRSPRPIDIQRVVNLVEMAVEQGETFEQAVSYGVQSILVSPYFLFRVENSPTVASASDTETLDDFALAARLSYFIWASMPDDQLLDLAEQNRLHDPEILTAQTKRMLADEKSSALVSRFFGQFLGLGNLRESDPDLNKFPLWNDRLRESLRKETELVCREIIQSDLPISTLMSGDFTFVNPRLAEFYGIRFEGQDPEQLYVDGPGFPLRRDKASREGAYQDEEHWIRVQLPAGRQGVLTHGSILTLTSNPTETSPVKRGKWILENILGDPPPPAPPNVPSLEETKNDHQDLSLREQLAIHRENPSCASCHNVMDPIGLGLENFDAVGRWRDKEGKHPIDAAGILADGRSFNGAQELIGLLEADIRSIASHFASKMLTYAIGRGLEPSDRCTVDDIVAAAKDNEYRFSTFVTSIVFSEPFGQRRRLTDKLVEND